MVKTGMKVGLRTRSISLRSVSTRCFWRQLWWASMGLYYIAWPYTIQTSSRGAPVSLHRFSFTTWLWSGTVVFDVHVRPCDITTTNGRERISGPVSSRCSTQTIAPFTYCGVEIMQKSRACIPTSFTYSTGGRKACVRVRVRVRYK